MTLEAKEVDAKMSGFLELWETSTGGAFCLRGRVNRGKLPLFGRSYQLSNVSSSNYMHLKGREKRKFVNDLTSFSDSAIILCNKSPDTPPLAILKCLSDSP